MGDIWVNLNDVGNCTLTVGATGDPLVGTTDVGSFGPLASTGYVFVGSSQIGTYTTAVVSLPEDARYRTKVYLDAYLSPIYLTKDDDVTQVSFTVMFANPNYPLTREFLATVNPVDLIFCVDTPDSDALPVGVGYIENMPISIWCIDKTGITGTKLRWKAERELRRISEANPLGSLRTLERLSDSEKNLGSTILYSVTYIMRYKRYAV